MEKPKNGTEPRRQDPPGIVIRNTEPQPPRRPAISAFIWGGKVRPVPTLPYGRWKPSAAA